MRKARERGGLGQHPSTHVTGTSLYSGWVGCATAPPAAFTTGIDLLINSCLFSTFCPTIRWTKLTMQATIVVIGESDMYFRLQWPYSGVQHPM